MYDFVLPKELIANAPVSPRDHARLLVYKTNDQTIHDDYFYNIENYLDPRTTLVVNNSKVERCRWLFNEGKTEIFVLEKNDPYTVRAMVRPGRRFKLDATVELTDFLTAKVLAIDTDGYRTLQLSTAHDDPRLMHYEHIPLPFYIPQNDELANEYQTVYAKPEGSLAAPTAGLHFTDSLYKTIEAHHDIAEVTLHVGLGTFATLTEDNIQQKRLHEEQYSISPHTAIQLNTAQHITAVGTTTVRTLESNRASHDIFTSEEKPTTIFIQPGFQFKAVDSLVTNFHLPSTSLLMLVAAFIAHKQNVNEQTSAKQLLTIYRHAIRRRYRFYSFGDAMLVL
jgi:S-adenosylmethionine:tRNA ribosyltransferase-isomerase